MFHECCFILSRKFHKFNNLNYEYLAIRFLEFIVFVLFCFIDLNNLYLVTPIWYLMWSIKWRIPERMMIWFWTWWTKCRMRAWWTTATRAKWESYWTIKTGNYSTFKSWWRQTSSQRRIMQDTLLSITRVKSKSLPNLDRSSRTSWPTGRNKNSSNNRGIRCKIRPGNRWQTTMTCGELPIENRSVMCRCRTWLLIGKITGKRRRSLYGPMHTSIVEYSSILQPKEFDYLRENGRQFSKVYSLIWWN